MSLMSQEKYRVSVNSSQPEQKLHADVQGLIDAGTTGVLVMTIDQTSGWQDPSAFGIVKKVPDTPPAPATPSAPTAPATAAVAPLKKKFDGFFAGFAEKLARKLAEMTGQPDPITGQATKQPAPHPTPAPQQTVTPAPTPTQPAPQA